MDRDNYTHYVKITAVNSLGERGAQSRLHSFVVRHSVEQYKQGLTFVFLDSGLLLADFLKKRLVPQEKNSKDITLCFIFFPCLRDDFNKICEIFHQGSCPDILLIWTL